VNKLYIRYIYMDIAYFNGQFLRKDEIKISPDDRGFLFADGIYEVIMWYQGIFYDMESHVARMKRSLRELRIAWPEENSFPVVAQQLINLNNLENQIAIVYLQITRGAAPRSHAFPSPEVNPTSYSFARSLAPNRDEIENGISVSLRSDIRWARCDIKSIALLPNILSFQEATEKGCRECVFIRNGSFTEGTHSNIFFVIDNILYTHPESEYILSGITRKNIIRIARESGLTVIEEAVHETMIENISEAFLAGTVSEVTPVTRIGNHTIGDSRPGPVAKLLQDKFLQEINALKG
jgi:D-alanine transaminase